MTEPFTEEQIPVEQVGNGDSLAIDQGLGRQLFQVESMTLIGVRDADDNMVEKFVLESEPLAGTGKPWVIDIPVGTTVTRLLRVR
jgi:hypothetical protein